MLIKGKQRYSKAIKLRLSTSGDMRQDINGLITDASGESPPVRAGPHDRQTEIYLLSGL
jgi:hypothetical protein